MILASPNFDEMHAARKTSLQTSLCHTLTMSRAHHHEHRRHIVRKTLEVLGTTCASSNTGLQRS